MDARYEYYQQIAGSVEIAMQAIRELPPKACFDEVYLEKVFIPRLGLNDEMLFQQPSELGEFFGKGLHLWQYPSQLSKFLVWLACNASHVRNYMEIGCRWGGTFILVTEWLKKIGADLQFAVAVDPIPATPFIKRYIEVSETPIIYLEQFSTSNEFKRFFHSAKPHMVFVDGDHSMFGVMNDHLLARQSADVIIHHDVVSNACPDTALFWNYAKLSEDGFESAEFTDQYASVNGSFLGIGCLKRRARR